MGILLCSRTFFAIQGVLYPASIVTNLTSGKLFVTWSYTASHAALSLTFPAVTSTPNTKPCLSQAVCASYANCRSCAPFTNIPQSGSVLDTVFSNRSSSGTSFIFVIIVIVDFLTQFFSFLGDLFTKLLLVHLRGLGDLFLLELLFIRGCFNMCSVDKNHAWVYHPVVQCFVQNMCKNFFTQLRGKRLQKA